MFLPHEVIIERPDGGTATVKCSLQQKNRSEVEGAGDFSVSDWLAIFHPGTALTTFDRVLDGSTEFEVAGLPWIVEDLAGNPHHVEATLRVAGSSDPGTNFPGEDDF